MKYETVNLLFQGGLAVLYVISTIILRHHQKTKIEALSVQINSQNELVANIEHYLKIFDPKVPEDYIRLCEKRLEEEYKSKTKEYETSFKSKFSEYNNEFDNLINFSISVIARMPTNDVVLKSIERLPESSTKKQLTTIKSMSIARCRDVFSELTPADKEALLKHPNYFWLKDS